MDNLLAAVFFIVAIVMLFDNQNSVLGAAALVISQVWLKK